MPCVRPRPLPLLAVVAASASLAGAGRLWFSALKSDRVVESPPALHAPPLVTPTAPEPPLVVHAEPVAPPPKPVVKHVRPQATHKAKPALTGQVGGISIVVDIGTAESHTETQQPVTPTKPIVVTPLPAHPGAGHGKAKPKSKPAKPVKPVTTPTPTPPVSAPTPPVTTPTPPAMPTPPVAQPTPPSNPSPPVSPTPPVVMPPSAQQPPPPVVSSPSPPVVNGPEGTSSDDRPGNGWGDKNHTHTGPPGQNKKNGG